MDPEGHCRKAFMKFSIKFFKAIANELILNIGSEKYDTSKKNQDFHLIVSKFIGHPMHRQIISGSIENQKTSF